MRPVGPRPLNQAGHCRALRVCWRSKPLRGLDARAGSVMFTERPDMIVFKSKIDRWLLLILLFSIAVSVAAAYASFKESGTVNTAIAAVILVLGGCLPAWLFLDTKYVVSGDELRVSCGPFSWSIPVSEITSVSETRNPLSSPALSLDRLELRYANGKSILLSPSDKQAFRAAIGHPDT